MTDEEALKFWNSLPKAKLPEAPLSDFCESAAKARLRNITPTADMLREWARRPKNRPPQSWWDADDNPFEPENEPAAGETGDADG